MSSTHHQDSTAASSHDQLNQTCDICCEECSKSYVAPCGDRYCLECVRKHVKYSMQQDVTFPVSCCDQEWPFDKFKSLLAPHSRLRYTAVAEEYSVASSERVWCANGCGAFLGSSATATKLVCKKCKKSTCTGCKEHEHEGECGAGDAALKALAESQGWQECTGCNAMVELSAGCNHISCRCGREFCYVCGAQWKTCPCQQYTQPNLERVLAGENGNGRCDRHDWRPVRGRRRCETCGERREHWRCGTCAAISCRDCRYPGERFGFWG